MKVGGGGGGVGTMEVQFQPFQGWLGGWLCGELGHGTLILLLISLLFFKSSFFGLSVGGLLGLERDTSSSIITNQIQNNEPVKRLPSEVSSWRKEKSAREQDDISLGPRKKGKEPVDILLMPPFLYRPQTTLCSLH